MRALRHIDLLLTDTLYSPWYFLIMENTSSVTSLRFSKISEQHLRCLKNTALFSSLSDEEMNCFCRVAQACSYKKGKVLYIAEERAKSFFVIVSGWIKLFHTTADGNEVIVDMLTAGQIVGESSIFEEGLHTSSAMVVGDVQLISLPASMLKEQIQLSPTLAFSMLSSMSRHHRRHYDEIALNAMQSAPQRIGCFLLKLCPPNKKRDVVLHFPFDKALIANILSIDVATFSRALKILRLKTDIRVDGSRVEIGSVERLMQYVHGSAHMQLVPVQLAPEKVCPFPIARDSRFAWNPRAIMRREYVQARHA